MNRKLENAFLMHTAVNSVLDQYNEVWKETVGFNTTVVQFRSNIAGIEKLNLEIDSKPGGVTKMKNQLKKKLQESVIEATSEMQVCFKRSNDTLTLQKIKISETGVKRLRDNKLFTFSKEVVDILNANLAALTDFNMTAEKGENIMALSTQFKTLIGQPRVVIVGKKTNRGELENLFKSTYELLNDELDKLMVGYKTSNPDFFSDYSSARKIVNYGVRHDKDDDDTNGTDNGDAPDPEAN